ncbi:MAG: hypothetical protein KA711_03845 [Ideonella sp. WA131b]|jgi:hypothetical protein|nr:hypothetical protein [Ideonella sp. WA131b]
MDMSRWVGWVAVLMLPVWNAQAQAPVPVPAEAFFADSPVADVKLAPSGRSVAMS